MTATIIAFPAPAARFDDGDLALMNEIADSYCSRGIWDRTDRESNRHGDMVLIWHPNRATPMYAFTRTASGYALNFCTGDRWQTIWSGPTAHDALKVWLERVRMVRPEPRYLAANS